MSIKKNSALLLFSIFFLVSTSFGISAEDWTLKKDEQGITVYTRKTENSAFKELKAKIYLKTSLSSIVAVLYDFEKYPEWIYRCGKSGSLKTINEKEVIHYQTIMAPWPVDNRDFIVNIKIEQDDKTKAITIKSYPIPSYIPAFPNYVRLTDLNASWVLTPQNDGTIEVTYQLLVDPGGYLPAWVVNMAIVDGPFETMSNIKGMVFKEEYQKTKNPFIKEPQ